MAEKTKFAEVLNNLSPEDRETFIKLMKHDDVFFAEGIDDLLTILTSLEKTD